MWCCPAARRWCEARGHGHEQRAARAAGAQGGRAARARRATTICDPLRARASPRPRLGDSRRRGGVGRAALAVAHARGHELRAPRGARRHPVALLRPRTTRAALPPRPPVGRDPATRHAGPVLASSMHEPPVDELDRRVPAPPDHRPPPRLLQHRGADRRYSSPLRRGETHRSVARRRRARSASTPASVVRVSSRRGRSRLRSASTRAARRAWPS